MRRPSCACLGACQPIGSEFLTAADTERLVTSLINEEQVKQFKIERTSDFSRGYHGLGRFRFNTYFQRDAMGLVARFVLHHSFLRRTGPARGHSSFALRPHGLILVTGPAGSGKSTTMAAINY